MSRLDVIPPTTEVGSHEIFTLTVDVSPSLSDTTQVTAVTPTLTDVSSNTDVTSTCVESYSLSTTIATVTVHLLTAKHTYDLMSLFTLSDGDTREAHLIISVPR